MGITVVEIYSKDSRGWIRPCPLSLTSFIYFIFILMLAWRFFVRSHVQSNFWFVKLLSVLTQENPSLSRVRAGRRGYLGRYLEFLMSLIYVHLLVASVPPQNCFEYHHFSMQKMWHHYLLNLTFLLCEHLEMWHLSSNTFKVDNCFGVIKLLRLRHASLFVLKFKT